MANPEHLQIISKGVDVWNSWRASEKNVFVDLSEADLTGANLAWADLSGVDLSKAGLSGANFSEGDLSRANLSRADLSKTNLLRANLSNTRLTSTNLSRADLSRADLSSSRIIEANLINSDLSEANLSWADLSRADLRGANFSMSNVKGTIFRNCTIGYTSFGNLDLGDARRLDSIEHLAPSSIGIDTLYLSKGKIPEVFLRGCGVPEDFIRYLPSLIGAEQVIQFYSCFISYSTQDEGFAKRLHSRMRDAKLRVWFAPEDMQGGKKIFEQIENAIHLHDRLILLLSEDSIKSEWVLTEIREALEAERNGQSKLFPIGLTDHNKIQKWKLIDTDTGKDLAKEIRSYHIPDFSNWKDQDSFETAFARLLKDLRAEEKNEI